MLNGLLQKLRQNHSIYSGWLRLAAPILAVVSLLLLPAPVRAQSDPFGEIDTVSIADVTIRPNASGDVDIHLFNDEALAGLTITLTYPDELISVDSVSFADSRAKNWTLLNYSLNEATKTITINGVALGSPALPAGSGVIATLHITANSGLNDGAAGEIKAKPGGPLELNTPQSENIVPVVVAGVISIDATNRAPQIKPIAPLTVMEGETVTLSIETSDPDNDDLDVFATNLTPGSVFENTSRNQSTFIWKVPYVGPGSATQSPYDLNIVAFDGKVATHMTVPVHVVNVNRSPSFTIGSALTGSAGDELLIPLTGNDPDFDAIHFIVDGLPAAVEINDANPGFIRWNSAIEDSGDYNFSISAVDEFGGSTTEFHTLQMMPSAPIELSIGEEQGFPAEYVDVYVSMHNRVPVAAFNVKIEYDKSILTLNKVDTVGTRLDQWQIFNYTLSSDGKIFVTADADNANPATRYLDEGEGPVVHLRFLISSNTSFAGFHTRLEYVFLDPQDQTENAGWEPDGTLIPRSAIEYTTGGVLIKKYDGLVGDINLNAVAFEIADLVYFTNYFVNPFEYPLDGARWQNSDINQNGTPAELADLIQMIQIVSGGSGKIATSGLKPSAEYLWEELRDRFTLSFREDAAFAAALFQFSVDAGSEFDVALTGDGTSFELISAREGDIAGVLLYSRRGDMAIARQAEELLTITASEHSKLISAEFVDERGELIYPQSLEKGILPESFQLEQNYPNPFNPETTISFELPGAAAATLEVYNILGEKISTLVDKVLPAGRHQVIFNGRNHFDQELPSGIYFYRLRTDAFEATRKMILLK